jgi:type IV secretory pathway component VirB8
MRSTLVTGFLFLQFFCACSGSEGDAGTESTTAESDVDAARSFIRSALDGKYDRARQFIVQDSVNTQYLDLFERNYKLRMDPEDKRGYRESSINIHDIRQVNDSTTVVNYSNSFKKQNDSLKVVRVANQWLVDLKYSFSPTDTAQ